MAKSAPVQTTESLSVQELERKIRDARYSVGEDRFIVTFEAARNIVFRGHRWKLTTAAAS